MIVLQGVVELESALPFNQADATMRIANIHDLARNNNVLKLIKLGAVPVFASDLPGIPAQEVIPMVVGVLRSTGLQPAQILLAATRDAAQSLLGRSDLGTLEPGKVAADLSMIDGDPIADLQALETVKLVVKDGVVVVDKR